QVEVSVEGAEGVTSLTVVGTALLGPALDYTVGIGEGAVTTMEGMRALFGEVPTAYFLVDYAAGVDPDQAFAALQADWGQQVLRPLPATDVENIRRVAGLPVALTTLLGLLAVATLGHTLATSVRGRRRELAVLKALGFHRGHVRATVAWQATAIVILALAVGLPLGVAGGRWAWQVVADGIGSPAPPVVPVAAVALAVPLSLLVANALAALPARAAANIRPAAALRAE
ncbi:MAG TPA: ABC transporter permease, partial [Acidimicrobiales bacterium]|nr:ABC transporter permease [Acidimicrobiales bacterium]